MSINQAYARLPVILQNAAVSAAGWRIRRRRYGSAFFKQLEARERYLAMPAEELRAHQGARLRQILRAARASRFWGTRLAEYGVKDTDDVIAEIQKLPLLAKSDIQGRSRDFIASVEGLGPLTRCSTRGTTGAGLVFWEAAEADAARYATWWRHWRWHGISMKQTCAYFGGRAVVPLSQKAPPYWRHNAPGRQILFSSFHINAKSCAHYVGALRAHRVGWVHGYPSALSLLASYMVEAGESVDWDLRIVTTSSENLLPSARHIMEKAFGCGVIEHYGLSEGVANFSTCERGKMHVDEDYALVEFVPDAEIPGSRFRIVGTNLTNPAFPFIRYDTGDLVELDDTKCACGNPGRVVASVDGRKEDYLILRDGTRAGSMLGRIFKDIDVVREAQFVQERPGVATLRIVRANAYSPEWETRIAQRLDEVLAGKLDVDITYVSRIGRTAGGKTRFVVSCADDAGVSAPAAAYLGSSSPVNVATR